MRAKYSLCTIVIINQLPKDRFARADTRRAVLAIFLFYRLSIDCYLVNSMQPRFLRDPDAFLVTTGLVPFGIQATQMRNGSLQPR